MIADLCTIHLCWKNRDLNKFQQVTKICTCVHQKQLPCGTANSNNQVIIDGFLWLYHGNALQN
jgi:hypothetical protein